MRSRFWATCGPDDVDDDVSDVMDGSEKGDERDVFMPDARGGGAAESDGAADSGEEAEEEGAVAAAEEGAAADDPRRLKPPGGDTLVSVL